MNATPVEAKIIFQLNLISEIHLESVSKELDNALVTIVFSRFVINEGTHTLSNTKVNLIIKNNNCT